MGRGHIEDITYQRDALRTWGVRRRRFAFDAGQKIYGKGSETSAEYELHVSHLAHHDGNGPRARLGG